MREIIVSGKKAVNNEGNYNKVVIAVSENAMDISEDDTLVAGRFLSRMVKFMSNL